MDQSAPEKQEPRALRVVAAVIRRADRFLVAQRPLNKHLGGKWEFPGGKVEPRELPEAALLREIREELGCELTRLEAQKPYGHDYGPVRLEMLPYDAALEAGSPEPEAREHIAIRWVTLAEVEQLDLAEADWPIVKKLRSEAQPSAQSQ
jgi:8-oxo-dGTP diphosphatase